MNHDQQLSELRIQEDQLSQKEREIVREKEIWKMSWTALSAIALMRTVIYGMHLNPILPLEIFFDQLQEGFLHESRKFQIVI